jgi:hypothetical protein
MPIWGSRRHVSTGKVTVLMACAARHGVSSVSVRTAADAHGVRVTVVALPGEVPARVTVHATRVAQNGKDGLERGGRTLSIACRMTRRDFFVALAFRNSSTRNREGFLPVGHA